MYANRVYIKVRDSGRYLTVKDALVEDEWQVWSTNSDLDQDINKDTKYLWNIDSELGIIRSSKYPYMCIDSSGITENKGIMSLLRVTTLKNNNA